MDIAVKSLDGSNAFIAIMQNVLCFQIGNECFRLVEEAARRHVCILTSKQLATKAEGGGEQGV